MSELIWVTHPECGLHEMGAGHPESPLRLEAVEARIEDSSIEALRKVVRADAVTTGALSRVHDAQFVEELLGAAPQRGYVQLDADTTMNPHTAEAALRAAGGCVQAVGEVLGSGPRQAFCAVRPPG